MSKEQDIRNSLHRSLYQIANDFRIVVKIAMLHAQAYDTAEPSSVDEVGECILRLQGHAFAVGKALEQLQRLEQSLINKHKATEQARQAAVGRIVEQGLNDRFNPHGFFVYLLWGTDENTPIYVGQSSNVLSRLGSHLGNREKRQLTRHVQIMRCANKSAMDRTEGALIRRYQPPLNVIGVGDRIPPGSGDQLRQLVREVVSR